MTGLEALENIATLFYLMTNNDLKDTEEYQILKKELEKTEKYRQLAFESLINQADYGSIINRNKELEKEINNLKKQG